MLNLWVKDAIEDSQYASQLMETMGDRIRILREARKLTQPQLAEMCGVTKGAVSQWESGSTANVKLITFMRLCEALVTDPQYLIWGAERAPTPSAPAATGRSRRPGDVLK